MKLFFSSFSGEYKRHLYRINMIAWAIILGMMLFHANAKVNFLKQNPQKINTFQKIQKTYFEGLSNYLMYQLYRMIYPQRSIILQLLKYSKI